jgi:DNA-binding SARP family transcriptional activator
MEIRLLGPVEVIVNDRSVHLGPPQRRAVFAALAVDAGRLVSLQSLASRVWDEPPDRATNSLYAHITRLRQALAEIAISIERRSGGYVLRVDRELVDLHRFQDLARRAQNPEHDAGHVILLEEALGLWRGSPLTDVSGDWAGRIRHGIEQQYVSATVAWAQAHLLLGRPAAVVTRLTGLVHRFPLAEPLAGLLMRGLCALGRTAEALAHYARLRAHLIEQLGTEPGAELRGLHEEMLRGRHDRPPQPVDHPSHPTTGLSVLAQLPPVVAGFTGRTAELSMLDSLLARPSAEAQTQTICVITGPAGVGKSALALYWAYCMAERFPDGHLYVDLRGNDPHRLSDPGEALAGILRVLGSADLDVPVDVEKRMARLRSLLARKRMLLVLDNASSPAQVWPMLPAGSPCAVVVTSRDTLADLVDRKGAHRLELGPLQAAEALTLLRRVVGDRVDVDPCSAAVLAERCARLPLALRIAGELAVARPAIGFNQLADELAVAAGAAAGSNGSDENRQLPTPRLRPLYRRSFVPTRQRRAGTDGCYVDISPAARGCRRRSGS